MNVAWFTCSRATIFIPKAFALGECGTVCLERTATPFPSLFRFLHEPVVTEQAPRQQPNHHPSVGLVRRSRQAATFVSDDQGYGRGVNFRFLSFSC